MIRIIATSVLLVAACGGGSGEPDARPDADLTQVDAAPREVIMASQPLVPGELVEGIMTGGPDDRASIHLTAPTANLSWNIHGHEGGETQTIYEEFFVMSADYLFVPTSQTDWWLLLRNQGPTDMTVELRVELHGAMTWRWQ